MHFVQFVCTYLEPFEEVGYPREMGNGMGRGKFSKTKWDGIEMRYGQKDGMGREQKCCPILVIK